MPEAAPALQVVIVDDEPLAREGIRARLATEPGVEVVGEAGDGPQAIETIRRTRPDLVFLDIQMPGCDGFAVVETVAESHLPIFVFVTAHDEYALRAFEAHAMDYLLKPVDGSRLAAALDRARREIERDEQHERQQRLLAMLDARLDPTSPDGASQPTRGARVRFTVKDGDRFLLIKATDVDWFEAAANYVRLHTRGSTYMMRVTMAELERRLDPQQFARIHRSTIVNVDRVREVHPDWHGDFDVLLRDGTALRLSRSYRERLLG